jgi:uncharacterized protein YbjT (DUF2867 family)
VRALVRDGAAGRLPAGAEPAVGDALRAESFAGQVRPAHTLVHLVGVPRPSPRKAREFREIDLASIAASVTAARAAGVGHLVYLSVAQPAPVMKAYVAARQEGERLIREAGLNATVLRPWYVLGPGHRWPYLLIPFYALAERIPAMRAGARRLGLVTRAQMVAALVRAVEDPPTGVRVVEVAEIRRA